MNAHSASTLTLNDDQTSSLIPTKVKALIELARPRHASKNLIVLLPWALTGFTDPGVGPAGALLVFCLFSIAVYAINDALDAFYDMSHPTKCHRPVASGRLNENEAFLFAGISIVLAILFGALIAPACIFFGLIYLGINIFYSMAGKDIPVVDVLLVSSGFVLRFLAGVSVIAAEADVSWAVGPIFLVATGLALGKRFAKQASSTSSAATTRIPGVYTADNLSGMLIFLSHLSVLFGAWFVFTTGTAFRSAISLSTDALYLIAIAAVFILSRVVFLMMRKAVEPAAAFTRDNATFIGSALIAVVVVGDRLI